MRIWGGKKSQIISLTVIKNGQRWQEQIYNTVCHKIQSFDAKKQERWPYKAKLYKHPVSTVWVFDLI